MTYLWNMLLRSVLPADLSEDIHFTVFVLGDSAYNCWPAKKLFRRMKGLWATEIYERGAWCNERVTADDWYQDVHHFQFSFEEDIHLSLDWVQSRVAVIHHLQPNYDVEEFLSSMGWGNVADEVYTLERVEKDQTMPNHNLCCASLRTIFTRYLDFKAVPRRTFFQYLRYFNTDEQESEKRDMHPREIQLCVTIVKYRTRLQMPRRGIYTSYFFTLQPGHKLTIGRCCGSINLPGQKTPIMCISPGTGVAPMRSLIEEHPPANKIRNMLYFVCRSALKDQHYGKGWGACAGGTNSCIAGCS
ncbi:hypothetical protein DFS33DRAFT_1270940 [Desarmillaria ectypa]|nr:hypothetical protein DFS33DRAFT_1270940 [Desarmillaria ectypa]